MPDEFDLLAEEAKTWRHHLHQHPELQFEERETAAYVARQLTSFGLEPVTGVGGTGVVAVIEGNRGKGRSIGLRSELDALPIVEESGATHTSRTRGVMHACGHDGHMAMLLGAAKHLATRREFAGRVVIIFQPAEEFGGGAEKMIEDGLFDLFDCDEVYALHNMPGLPVGTIGGAPGPAMGAARAWDLTVKGRGAHAALPHLGVDGISVAMEFISGCQAIIARELDPLTNALITPTQIQAGSSYNIIPAEVHVGGTIRTLSDPVMTDVITRMTRLAKGIGIARECSLEFEVQSGYPVTVNHDAPLVAALDVAEGLFGADHVLRNAAPKMITEDFSYMLNARPGAYLFLGAGDGPALHNPFYDFPDALITTGICFWSTLVHARLAV